MLLYGARSVLERIRTNPQSIRGIYLQEGVARPDISRLAKKKGIPIKVFFGKRFNKLAKGALTQGVIADIEKFQYQDFEEIISKENKKKLTLIFLDRVTDPQNLGAILRNCACLGKFAIILPRHDSVDINQTVLKVACGAENYLPIALVSNLSNAIKKAKEQGYWIGAAVIDGGLNPRDAKFNFPLGLLFGSEGEGVRPALLKHIDYKLTLPMRGASLSYNVAMSVGILCYEVSCRRSLNKKSS